MRGHIHKCVCVCVTRLLCQKENTHTHSEYMRYAGACARFQLASGLAHWWPRHWWWEKNFANGAPTSRRFIRIPFSRKPPHPPPNPRHTKPNTHPPPPNSAENIPHTQQRRGDLIIRALFICIYALAERSPAPFERVLTCAPRNLTV